MSESGSEDARPSGEDDQSTEEFRYVSWDSAGQIYIRNDGEDVDKMELPESVAEVKESYVNGNISQDELEERLEKALKDDPDFNAEIRREDHQ
jgi:biopolymer transport protein ExbD